MFAEFGQAPLCLELDLDSYDGPWQHVAPTTLLARQHYQNFIERFGDFPLKIGRLSRLVSAREMKETREGLAKADIDIVIGTHAILSKSTRFKDLALVVVDEEQQIGRASCRERV